MSPILSVAQHYGLITNGGEFMFIKMLIQGLPQYDLSDVFSLLIPRRNQLYNILQVLKQIRQIMLKDTGWFKTG